MQVPAEVQGSWKALRALCWCDDQLARVASRHWLQQLLAVTLQQSLKVRLCPCGLVFSLVPYVCGTTTCMAAACTCVSFVMVSLFYTCACGDKYSVKVCAQGMLECAWQR